jgi:hypothetical protein
MSFEQFAKGITYTVKVEIETDYETVATTEIELLVDPNYDKLVNTDEVIEWLGKMERNVLSDDVKNRYDEYLNESEGYDG